MNSNFRYTFKPVEEKDRNLVCSWLGKPYIAEWFYGEGLDNTYKHLDEFISGTSDTMYWLAYDANTPFAFLVTSFVKKPKDELSRFCATEGVAITLDMLIGEEQYLGKKLSHILIREFLLSEFPGVEEVLIDPEASNSRAIHVYEKVGFKFLNQFVPSHSPHPHYMMRLHMRQLKHESFRAPISVRPYRVSDAKELAKIYYNTIHEVNTQDYSQEQVDVWAPETSLDPEGWMKKFDRTKPLVATSNSEIVGFAEFEPDGHIDCFYCHHDWIGKGVGAVLMKEIFAKAMKKNISRIFAEVSITAKPFFEKHGFEIILEQEVEKEGVKLVNFKMEKVFNK